MPVTLENLSDDEEEPLFDHEDVERKTFEREVSFQEKIKEFIGDKQTFKQTLCFCGVFMVFGMSDELLGPTLLELRCLTGQSLTIMSLLFFVHDLCNVLGSTSGGILADR